MRLHIYTSNLKLRNLLHEQINKQRWTDSGFDVPMLAQTTKRARQITFDFDMVVAATNSHGHPEPLLLVPRSSFATVLVLRLRLDVGLGLELFCLGKCFLVPQPRESSRLSAGCLGCAR